MESEETWPTLTVTKLDGARRQFETAISLWFADGDEVSIRMLTAGAHQVCRRILKASGGESPMFYNEAIWPPDAWQAFKTERKAENFFKHASEDPDPAGTYTFRPEVTRWYLNDGVEMYHTICSSMTELMRIFRVRFQLDYTDGYPELQEQLTSPEAIRLRSLGKAAFLQECRENVPALFREMGV